MVITIAEYKYGLSQTITVETLLGESGLVAVIPLGVVSAIGQAISNFGFRSLGLQIIPPRLGAS